jgi:hypothetical protein
MPNLTSKTAQQNVHTFIMLLQLDALFPAHLWDELADG